MPDREDLEMPGGRATEKRDRATPLKPVVWMTGVLVWATVVGLFLRIPTWAGIFLCLLTGASFLLFLGSYLFLMVKDRDALREERNSFKLLPPNKSGLQGGFARELLESDPDLSPGSGLPKGKKETREFA